MNKRAFYTKEPFEERLVLNCDAAVKLNRLGDVQIGWENSIKTAWDLVIKICEECMRACANGKEMGFSPDDCRSSEHWTMMNNYDDLQPHQKAVYRRFFRERPTYTMWRPPPVQESGGRAAVGAPKATAKATPKLCAVSGGAARGTAIAAFGAQVGQGA